MGKAPGHSGRPVTPGVGPTRRVAGLGTRPSPRYAHGHASAPVSMSRRSNCFEMRSIRRAPKRELQHVRPSRACLVAVDRQRKISGQDYRPHRTAMPLVGCNADSAVCSFLMMTVYRFVDRHLSTCQLVDSLVWTLLQLHQASSKVSALWTPQALDGLVLCARRMVTPAVLPLRRNVTASPSASGAVHSFSHAGHGPTPWFDVCLQSSLSLQCPSTYLGTPPLARHPSLTGCSHYPTRSFTRIPVKQQMVQDLLAPLPLTPHVPATKASPGIGRIPSRPFFFFFSRVAKAMMSVADSYCQPAPSSKVAAGSTGSNPARGGKYIYTASVLRPLIRRLGPGWHRRRLGLEHDIHQLLSNPEKAPGRRLSQHGLSAASIVVLSWQNPDASASWSSWAQRPGEAARTALATAERVRLLEKIKNRKIAHLATRIARGRRH